MSFCYIDDLQQQYPGWIYKKGLKFNSEEIIFVLKHQYSKEHTIKKKIGAEPYVILKKINMVKMSPNSNFNIVHITILNPIFLNFSYLHQLISILKYV